jgi:AraC-like DNA-binding protein
MPVNGSGFLNYDQQESGPMVNALLNLPSRHFKGNIQMKTTLESILSVAGNEDRTGLRKIMLDNLLISFLIQVITAGKRGSQYAKELSEKAEKINGFISDHFREELTVESMARILHLSESRFKGWFKEEFGVPPLGFILRKRIEEAKMLMATQPLMKMSDLAYSLGFSSPQYFATVFKRYTFLSPTQYKDHQAKKPE